jgi:hypothetical protein
LCRSPRFSAIRLYLRLQWIVLPLAIIVIGCTPEQPPQATPTPLPQSAWGPIYTIGFAPQVDAPAFTLSNNQLAFAWVGSDHAGVHQDVRTLTQAGLSGAAALPLSPFAPRDLSVWPAIAGGTQLLYLDEHSASQTYRLYSSVFTAPYNLVQGPTLISDQQTARYSVLADVDDSLQIVWSTGSPLESRLYYQRVDASGRPQPSSLLTIDADYPALAASPDGAVTLFWLEPNADVIYRALLSDQGLQEVQSLGAVWERQAGELLLDFSVVWTQSGFLLLWNTLLSNAMPQAYGSLLLTDRNGITAPLPLTTSQTGVSQPLHWLTVEATNTGLAAAAMVGNELGMLQWNGQAFTDFQPVVTPEAPLIGFPHLMIDLEGQRYLAWAEPRTETYAELRFTMTRTLDSLNP